MKSPSKGVSIVGYHDGNQKIYGDEAFILIAQDNSDVYDFGFEF